MNKFRIKCLTKISQMSLPTNLPTEGIIAEKTVSGTPTTFIATSVYPNIIRAFGSNYLWINELCHLLNIALYFTSNGKIDLNWMRNNNFNFDSSNAPSIDLKNLMKFSHEVYTYILSESQVTLLDKNQLNNKIEFLKNSVNLSNLSSTNPMGILSSKIGGNIKSKILQTLSKIK